MVAHRITHSGMYRQTQDDIGYRSVIEKVWTNFEGLWLSTIQKIIYRIYGQTWNDVGY